MGGKFFVIWRKYPQCPAYATALNFGSITANDIYVSTLATPAHCTRSSGTAVISQKVPRVTGPSA